MELSAKSLECLETFRKRVFESDEHVRKVGQETMDMLLQKTNQSTISNCGPSANVSSESETEDAKCQYGLSALFLQSARHGFESEELKDYLKQLGWTDTLASSITVIYDSNRELLRKRIYTSKPLLPRLTGVCCTPLIQKSSITDKGVDFSNNLSRYRVEFSYENVDGTPMSMSRDLNSVQLENIIREFSSALNQCDLLLNSQAKKERAT